MDDLTEDSGVAQPARRQLIKGATVGLAAGVAAVGSVRVDSVFAAETDRSSALAISKLAFDNDHVLQPLPFDAANLTGLSAGLIESHWANNYGGSVRALNETNKRLAQALADPDMPAFIYNDLKREHLMRTGSVVLHELYFENLGGDGAATAGLRSQVAQAFGNFDRWETEFRRIAGGLGGGSGWVILGYNRHFQALENYWMADHMHSPATTVPLLVLDMYEHSYHMDYGAATARYVDAFFKNINWDRVVQRMESIS